jgi:hypothetical protein
VRFPLPEREFHVLRHAQRYRSRLADALLAGVRPPAKPGSRPSKRSR